MPIRSRRRLTRQVRANYCLSGVSRRGPNPEERYENLAKWSNSICMNGRLVILDLSLTGSSCPGIISDDEVKKTKFGGYVVNG